MRGNRPSMEAVTLEAVILANAGIQVAAKRIELHESAHPGIA